MSRLFTQLRRAVADINHAERRLFELRTAIPGEERPRGGRSRAAR